MNHNQDLTAVTENANWKKCFNINGNFLAVCIYNCEDNGDCEKACISQFKQDTADCPCEVGQIIYYWHRIIGPSYRVEIFFDKLFFRRTVQLDVHVTPMNVKMSVQQ